MTRSSRREPSEIRDPAQVVNDCRFLKDDDERLICFNRFVETPTERVAPGKPAKPEVPEKSATPVAPEKPATLVAPEKPATPVAPKATSAAPKPVEPRTNNKDSFDLWWEWVKSHLIAR